MPQVQRFLLEKNKTVDKANNQIIWELLFWNENMPHMIEKIFVPQPIETLEEQQEPEEIPEQSQVEEIPVTDTIQ